MTAAKLICENRRDEAGKQLLLELDEIQDQVEKYSTMSGWNRFTGII